MKISNTDEFSKALNFCFSGDYEMLKETEQNELKEEILNSRHGINESVSVMCTAALDVMIYQSSFYTVSLTKLHFILENISHEDRICITEKYLKCENAIKTWRLNEKVLLPVLDYFDREERIKLLSKISPTDLLRKMSDLRTHSIRCMKEFKFKKRKYYEEYYNIFKSALDEQNNCEKGEKNNDNQ